MDERLDALSPATRIRVAFAEVTMAAKALEARHLCGPAAGCVLGEGLAAAALLAVDLRPDEAVSLHLRVSGPVQGLMVEARGDGSLRGYTHRKILDALDGGDAIRAADALGDAGQAHILTSAPGRVLNRASFAANPPWLRMVLARYWNHSLQRPAGAELAVRSSAGGLIAARGIVAERMPDGDHDAFVRVLERLTAGTVGAALAAPEAAGRLAAILDLPDLEVRSRLALRFHCACSAEKAAAVLEALPREELAQIAAAGQPQSVLCHMCGRAHEVASESIRQLLDRRRGGEKQ
jgi:molecular chaperone Hsp33